MHRDTARAVDSLRTTTEHAGNLSWNIKRGGEVFDGTLHKFEMKHQHAESILRQSDQLLAAMAMASVAAEAKDAACQTVMDAEAVATTILEVLDAHALAGSTYDASAGDTLSEWKGGWKGRAKSADRVRELLLATGLSRHTTGTYPSELAIQADLIDDVRETWPEPLPLSWAPLISTLCPLPAGILSQKRLRTLVWAIYGDRFIAEYPMMPLPKEFIQDEKITPKAAAVATGGAQTHWLPVRRAAAPRAACAFRSLWWIGLTIRTAPSSAARSFLSSRLAAKVRDAPHQRTVG